MKGEKLVQIEVWKFDDLQSIQVCDQFELLYTLKTTSSKKSEYSLRFSN